MRVGYSAGQIRAAEAPLLEAGEPLMRRAATGLAAVLRELLADHPGTVLLLVGSGDNGGDALFAGAELAAEGVAVQIVGLGSRMHEAGSAEATEAGAEFVPLIDLDDLVDLAAHAAIVVDGLVGTGADGDPALRGGARDAVAALLPILSGPDRPLIVAVDIPSGIDPSDGSVPDSLVLPADVTVTFGGIKAGLLLEPASSVAGQVVLIDIGLREQLAETRPVVQIDDAVDRVADPE